MKVVAVVLAAGASRRFGSPKLLAPLAGRPLLQHVLDAVDAAGLREVVVVLGRESTSLEAGMVWRAERRVVNPRPQDGLSSSLRIGLDAAAEDSAADAALVLLGDQPSVDPAVIASVVAAAATRPEPIIRVRYAGDEAPNPVLIRRSAWARAAGLDGDRGLAPLLAAHPELVGEVPAPGRNPDVDTLADLVAASGAATEPALAGAAAADRARALEQAWADRVRANRDQAEGVREVEEGDFYAPVSALFVADPRRADEPTVEALRSMAAAEATWLDIGAGAGRYALPLALCVRRLIAVEPSPGMRRALRTGVAKHGISNVRIVAGTWPEALDRLGRLPAADVSLIAHVGYDIEAIGPFLDAMEAATRDRCVAVFRDRSPASVADPLWPIVHGQPRSPLPALPELLELLHARARRTEVARVTSAPRSFESADALTAFLRRQLFIAQGGEKDERFRAELRRRMVLRDDGWTLATPPEGEIGIVTWRVPPR